MSQYLDWKVGDKVVCVDDQTCTDIGAIRVNYLQRDRVYTIRKIGKSKKNVFLLPGHSDLHVWVIGIDRPGDLGFAIERFRKVQPRKTDISIFTQMLNPSKQRERA